MAQEPETLIGEEPPRPKKKSKKIIFLVLLVLILAGGGLMAYLLLTDDPEAGAAAAVPAKAAAHQAQAAMPLESFLVNLADQDARRYLKVKVELEVEQEKYVKGLEKSLPHIRDDLILLLSSKTYAEIATQEGKRQLKEEMQKRLAAIPGSNKVKHVFFTEFVAQ